MKKATLLMTGNELVQGHIIDTNAQIIASCLNGLGFDMLSFSTVGDDLDRLAHKMKQLSEQADLVFINGGLGPTQDDKTAEALAIATDCALVSHTKAHEHILRWCEQRQIVVNEKQLKQRLLPQGVEIFEESIGSALGFYLKGKAATFIVTPGVPAELKHLLKAVIPDFLRDNFSGLTTEPWHRLQLFGASETRLETLLEEQGLTEGVSLGFRVHSPYLELKYRFDNNTSSENKSRYQEKLEEAIAPYFIGRENTRIAMALAKNLLNQNATISTAESCTGGMIASLITQESGSSSWFEGGLVTYSNTLKEKLLNVPSEILETHGAVSEQTALAMLEGLLKTTHTQVGVVTTGIAGPTGGTDEKPTGTVFIGYGNLEDPQVVHLVLPFDRKAFQRFVSHCALDLARHFVSGNKAPSYLDRWKPSTSV